MSRPVRSGLDYFPLDTAWDVKMKLMKAKYKLVGVGCIIELFKAIYAEGYALKWDEDTRLIFADENGLEDEKLDEIVSFALEKGIFDQGIFEREGYLTSHGIQSRWLKISQSSKRQNAILRRELDLLGVSSGYTPEETRLTPEETPLIPEEMPQSKVKESKVKERREREAPSAPPSPPAPSFDHRDDEEDVTQTLGKFKLVKLKTSAYFDLLSRYGQAVTEDYIGRLDRHMKSTGKKYQDHHAVIIDWLIRDKISEVGVWSSAPPPIPEADRVSPEAAAAITMGARAKLKIPVKS